MACGFGDLSLQPPTVARGGQKRGTRPVAVMQAAPSFHDPLRGVTGGLPTEVTVFSSRLDSLSWKPEYPHPWGSSQADGLSLPRQRLLLDLAEPHPELAFRTPGFWEKSWMSLDGTACRTALRPSAASSLFVQDSPEESSMENALPGAPSSTNT